MSIAWIKAIKNSSGEYHFCVPPTLPNITSIQAGTNSYSFGGYREASSEAGSSANFIAARAACKKMMEDAAADTLIWDGVAQGSLDKWVYGKSGGTGVHFVMPRVGTTFKNFNLTRYYSFSDSYSYQPAFSSGSVDNGGNYYNSFAGLALLYDDVLNVIAPVFVIGSCSWSNNNHNPTYYDSANYSFTVFAGTAVSTYTYRNNYYPIFFTSIYDPSGGEGPYTPNDIDEPVGGNGNHDDISDTVETSPIPVAAATRCGMITAFVPTWGEIQSVADALLDPNIFQILGSAVVKAADVIIGLSVFPCTVPANSTATVAANFLGINIGTGVIAHVADNQYVEIDCGDLDINEYWGNCLDYNPYTNISIFLPFCGMYELDADEVMGRTINVSYRIDIFSGACLATIKIDGSVFYQYTGQCSSQIPLNSVSFDNFLSSMLDVGIATATGVAAVKGAAGELAAASKAFSEAKSSEAKGAFEDYLDAKANYTKVKEHSGESLLGASVNGVIGGKGFYSHAGAVGGSPGFLAVKKPFVIIKRPEQVIPSMYGKFHGYPANTTANLNDLTGYTEVSDIRLNIPDATVDEIIECEQLLKGGVVL